MYEVIARKRGEKPGQAADMILWQGDREECFTWIRELKTGATMGVWDNRFLETNGFYLIVQTEAHSSAPPPEGRGARLSKP